MNGLLNVIERLKEKFDGEFVITPGVKHEVIDRPMKINKYKLEALQVKQLLDKGIFRHCYEIVSAQKLDIETKRILKIANSSLRSLNSGEKINLIHEGEASCLAFANLCSCDSVIVIDERTTRLIGEAPKNLEKMMEKKLHTSLQANPESLKFFRKFRFIRSSELLFVAFKKGLIPLKKDKQTLEALLYGVKYKGTSISEQEIEEMKKMV